MKYLVLSCLLVAGCSPVAPDREPTPTPVATVAAASPAVPPDRATPQPSVDEGPPLPLLLHRPPGDPRDGLARGAGQPGYDEVKTLADNPVPWTSDNVMEGQLLYRQHCSSCHCWDGDGDGPASVGLHPQPRNFSRLQDYRFGTGDVALFRTSRYGIPGSPMLPAPAELSDAELWKIVHFLRFLQPVRQPAEVLIDLGPKTPSSVKSGFYDGEVDGRDTWAWTQSRQSRFRFALDPRPGPYTLSVRARPLTSLPRVDVAVSLNGRIVGKLEWQNRQFRELSLELPPGSLKKGDNELVLRYGQGARLAEGDERQSSLALDYVRVTPGRP